MVCDHPGRCVPVDRLARATGRQFPRRLLLPVGVLAPHLGDLGRSVAFRQGPEGCSGFNGLKLLGVSHHHDLRAGGFRVFDHTLHLSRPHQASLVDHEHIVGRKSVPAARPRVLETGDRP